MRADTCAYQDARLPHFWKQIGHSKFFGGLFPGFGTSRGVAPGNLSKASRCGAKNRKGSPCRQVGKGSEVSVVSQFEISSYRSAATMQFLKKVIIPSPG